ncbi:MAG: hypothetical protein H3Z53_04720 [archaeon]|nr:hypothetical protein [archaeon]MCP8313661.1 hypothetical protein [archaeon]
MEEAVLFTPGTFLILVRNAMNPTLMLSITTGKTLWLSRINVERYPGAT